MKHHEPVRILAVDDEPMVTRTLEVALRVDGNLECVAVNQPMEALNLLKESAIRSINEIGLFQYIEKPWDNALLRMVLRNAAERTVLLRQLQEENGAGAEIRDRIWRLLL